MQPYGPRHVIALFRLGALLLFLAAMVAMALGKISFYIGAGGLVGVIVLALISGSMKKRALQRAIKESELP